MIYFDNAATTRALDEVADKVKYMLLENFGNPSSQNMAGVNAENEVIKARKIIAASINAEPDEIYFTSGGTESDNWAIFGTAKGYIRSGKHMITTAIEHPAVLQPMRELEKNGWDITILGVDEKGYINIDELKAAIREDTVLVSTILINNETGTIQNAEEISKAIKSVNPHTLYHVDAVQAYGKYPINVKKMGIDMLSVSGHKVHGPKGVGFFYMKKGLKVKPIIFGGGHERGLRSGTENTPSIVGLAEAVKIDMAEMDKAVEHVKLVKKTLAEGILNSIPMTYINGPSIEEGSPYVLNIGFEGLRSEVLLHSLEEKEIYVSAGSACNSKKKGASTVLSALGIDEKRIEGAIRFSFCRYNTVEEAEQCIEILKEKAAFLRKYMR
ncbi:cysteine desulfurase family protein [Anaerotignum sp. MSJ-24]|uniref:cysteine desulfurase family protein n=1 Tax=Anaerotignum sp. MSJ-24 TaxID=2841521 RepID=UPI001C123234|nr:cysteine desulfurase family protein [Anaerotignum sp. MSJ-24]MBU5463904.1 cysteine desulfurase [Anaerotignum sp. MSJ-24]